MNFEFKVEDANHMMLYCDSENLIKEIHKYLTVFNPASHFMQMDYGQWDGKIRFAKFINANVLSFPLGLYQTIQKKFELPDIPSNMFPRKFEWSPVDHADGKDLFDFQKSSIEYACESQRCIIESPTGSGKSIIAAGIFKAFKSCNPNFKMLVVVPRADLRKQISKTFEDEPNVTVTTWQKLNSMVKQKDLSFVDIDCIIGDEAHTFNASSLKKIMKCLPDVHCRIGMTATVPRQKLQMFNVFSHFSGDIYKTGTTKSMIEQGRLSNVHVTSLKFESENYSLFNMQGKDYANEMKFLDSFEPRNEYIINNIILSPKQMNKNRIIFVRTIQHQKLLANILKESDKFDDDNLLMLSAKVSDDTRAKYYKMVEEKNGLVLIGTYSLLSTGLDFKNLHTAIFAGCTKNRRLIIQSIGRILRLHESKEYADVIDIMDGTFYSKAHGKERLKIYKQEKHNVKKVKVAL